MSRQRPRRLRAATGALARPLAEFLQTEGSGGAVLLLATVAALVWANVPARATYEQLWSAPTHLRLGPVVLPPDLRHWVNEGLMTLFFFVVGLEIKRELVRGELREPRRALLPLVGAAGGLVVPAAIYLAVVGTRGEAARGWGIPMATDIAFAVGVLTLLGSRVPSSLRLFVLALAIVDDIGAIAVITLAYPSDVRLAPLGIGAAFLVAVLLMRVVRRWSTQLAMLLGAGAWLALLRSGVEATIAGVALGFLVPAGSAHGAAPVGERLEERIHPWASYVVIPLFALANAGLTLDRSSLSAALGSRVTLGVALGLALGKVAGISGFSWVAQRLGLAAMPQGTTWPQFVGGAAVAGIGFTVALFITALAFEDPALAAQSKVGILAGSLAAACTGAVILRVAARAPT